MLGPVRATSYAVLKTLAISVPTVAEGVAGTLTTAASDRRLRDWSSGLLARAEVALSVEGAERVPRDRACLFMSNHQSHYDIPICFCAWPGTSLRMVAKAELFRIPVWGRAMRASGFVPVERSGNREDAKRAMALAARSLEAGISVWSAPEGTRSLDGKLGRFKKGGFMLAQAAGAPIVPAAILGSRDIIPKRSWLVRPGASVKVVYGAPIESRGAELADLMAQVRAFLLQYFESAE